MTNMTVVYETPTLDDVREFISAIHKQQGGAQEHWFRAISRIDIDHADYLKLLGDLFPNMSPVPSDTSSVEVSGVRVCPGSPLVTEGKLYGGESTFRIGTIGKDSMGRY